MKKTLTIGVIVAMIAAVGAVGMLTSVNFIQEAQAESCNKVDTGQSQVGCHGCQFASTGYFKSQAKCHHHETS